MDSIDLHKRPPPIFTCQEAGRWDSCPPPTVITPHPASQDPSWGSAAACRSPRPPRPWRTALARRQLHEGRHVVALHVDGGGGHP